jgi:deazaflavin-dependent oxidoreductase (nitroreductase family)
MARTIDRVYGRLHRLLMPPGRQQTALDRLGVRWWTRMDSFFFRHFGWSAAAKMMGVDVLLLRTTGRRSGRTREVMVACLDRGDHLLVGGGNWGWDRDPAWVYNAAAHPDVEVVRRRRCTPMRATVLEGSDAVEGAEALALAYPHSQVYIQRRTRPLPVVRLDPHL